MTRDTSDLDGNFHYSNLGYVIAGTIVEKVSGERFDIHQQKNIMTYLS